MKSMMKAKAMKSMMKAKAMKTMMKRMKAKKISKRTAVNRVFAGKLNKTKSGRVVSKKLSARGKASKWIKAVTAARKALGVKGFCAVGGKAAKGQALLKKARSLYK